MTRDLIGSTNSSVHQPGASPVSRTASHGILTLPSFRSEKKNVIKNDFEFLGKVRALLEAHEFPEKRWLAAILTSPLSIDRQWATSNLKGCLCTDIQRAFFNYSESPALQDMLIRDLINIYMTRREIVQQ